jgi:hypothetical protein
MVWSAIVVYIGRVFSPYRLAGNTTKEMAHGTAEALACDNVSWYHISRIRRLAGSEAESGFAQLPQNAHFGELMAEDGVWRFAMS